MKTVFWFLLSLLAISFFIACGIAVPADTGYLANIPKGNVPALSYLFFGGVCLLAIFLRAVEADHLNWLIQRNKKPAAGGKSGGH